MIESAEERPAWRTLFDTSSVTKSRRLNAASSCSWRGSASTAWRAARAESTTAGSWIETSATTVWIPR